MSMKAGRLYEKVLSGACRVFVAWMVLVSGAGACMAGGMVSLTFDDGLKSVYDEAFPVLGKYNIKATAGIVLNRVTCGNDDYMNVEEVLELQRAGWEIASHSVTHKRPTEIPRFYSEEPITDWYTDDEYPGVYQSKYNYEKISGLLEGDKVLKELGDLNQVRKTPGTFYFDQIIWEVHVHPYKKVSPEKLQVRSISYQREMEESSKGLEKLGFKVSSYVAPYNYWTTEISDKCKEYYRQAANGKQEANFREKFDRFWLTRFNVRTTAGTGELIRIIQRDAVEKNGWVIFCFHGIEDDLGWEPWSTESLEQLAMWLRENDIKTVTISEGVALFDPAGATTAEAPGAQSPRDSARADEKPDVNGVRKTDARKQVWNAR